MPEEMEGLEQEQAAPESESQPQKKPKTKKKKAKLGKFAYLLLFMVILAGVGAGMHIAGAWDARPLMYEAVPRIPWVGKRLAALTGIPATVGVDTSSGGNSVPSLTNRLSSFSA